MHVQDIRYRDIVFVLDPAVSADQLDLWIEQFVSDNSTQPRDGAIILTNFDNETRRDLGFVHYWGYFLSLFKPW